MVSGLVEGLCAVEQFMGSLKKTNALFFAFIFLQPLSFLLFPRVSNARLARTQAELCEVP